LLGANSGSTGTLNIGSTGNWTGIEGDTWFSLGQSSGSGISMVSLTTNSTNTSMTQRISYVALADAANSLTDTVVIIQDTATTGLVTTPDTIRLNASAGSSNTFDVSTSLGWAASTSAAWLSVTPNGGTGSGTVTVSANANPMMTERIDFIKVETTGGSINLDTVWVIQSGLVTNLEVSPNTINLNFANGSNDVIALTSNTSWTVTNPASWLSLTPTAGSNDATLTATATSDNLSGATRSATITVDGIGAVSKMVTINQIDGSTPSFTSSKDTVFVDNTQGSTGNFSILSNVNSWTLAESTPWLLVNPTSGSQTESITVLVATRNILGIARYAEITASASGFPNKTIVVAQKESTPFFQIAPDSIIVGADSASFVEFNISSNMPTWTISEGAAWLEISPETGSFTQRVRATAIKKNTASAQRSIIATISSPPLVPQTIKIVQDTVRSIGINEKSFEKAFTLYPNPTSGNIIVNIGNEYIGNGIEASLYNLIGEEIPVTIDFSNSSTTLINLSDQANGICFLRIRYRNEIFSKKISLIK
ncbi:MAG: T9SS type A sorting domain-containing protein, partial [Flavobacteriales bacterium]|nr:T9SS type A sorting domain-containing protein [Flavobacteriales bacterium]